MSSLFNYIKKSMKSSDKISEKQVKLVDKAEKVGIIERVEKAQGPLVKGLRHRLFTAVTRVRIPYGLYFMEDYPSPAEGNGLENRQACKSVRGFESHILLRDE